MVDRTQIKPHMDVIGSDGLKIGTVDSIDGERIKLAKSTSPDGEHHYVPLESVARIDEHVHLSTAGAAATGAGVHLPPVLNRAVDDAKPRGNFYLPWIVGAIGLILLLLALSRCGDDDDRVATAPPPVAEAPATTAALPVESVTLPGGRTVDLAPNTLNYELQRFLASGDAAPRSFTFDKLNFNTGSALIRGEDNATLDALGQILTAYPAARGTLIGYTDTRGSSDANAGLGQQRAAAVMNALTKRGVAANRLTAKTGGEANPADTNTTAGGQFENRRTELTITAK